MARTLWSRISVVLLLLLFLTPAAFATPQQEKHRLREAGILAWLASEVDRFLSWNLKSSGTMDPDGKPQVASPPPAATNDSSGTMDPDGRT